MYIQLLRENVPKICIPIYLFSGVIGIGPPVDMSETRGALHAFNIPLIAVGHNSGYVGQRNYDNILSTAPDVQGQAQVFIFDNLLIILIK